MNKSIVNEDCIKQIEKIIDKNFIKLNEPMSKHTSFRVGGNADAYIIVQNKENLIEVLKIAKEYNLPITIVGNGTNLLVKDNGIRGLVINYASSNFEIIDANKVDECQNNTEHTEKVVTKHNAEIAQGNEYKIKVDSGVKNGVFAQFLLKNELTGFEFAAGIPGTIGGAIYMNAGAFGGEIANIVESVTYISLKDLKIYTLKNEQCEFAYRTSIFEQDEDKIILEAIFNFKKGKKEEIAQKMDEFRNKRLSSQPLDKPSAGSTFKRGENFITAKLIDECNLKGYKIGGAQVSEKHAGFIINTGNASAKDIIDLIEYVKTKVYEKFGVEIKPEVRVIGE